MQVSPAEEDEIFEILVFEEVVPFVALSTLHKNQNCKDFCSL
jgi:hypothetical protein